MELTTVLINLVGVLIGAGAGSFFGLKGALNGMRRDIAEIKQCAGKIEDGMLILLDRGGR